MVIGLPPLSVGALNDTSAAWFCAVAVPIVGAAGEVGMPIRLMELLPELATHMDPSGPAAMP